MRRSSAQTTASAASGAGGAGNLPALTNPNIVFYSDWPQHLVPLWIDSATSRPFQHVLDVIHLEGFTTLRFYKKPTLQRNIPGEFINNNAAEALLSPSSNPSRNMQPADQPLDTSPRDAYQFDTTVCGSVCLVGASLSTPEGGMYTLQVPNHRFHLKPQSQDQNTMLQAEMSRYLAAANTPYFDSPIVFLRLRLEVFDTSLKVGEKHHIARTTVGGSSGTASDDTPSSPKAASPRSLQNAPEQHKYIKGVYVTVKEGLTELSKQAQEQLFREQHENPKSGNHALAAPNPQGNSQNSTLTFYHEIPKNRSRDDCVVVMPFEVAGAKSVSIGLEHAQWGRLFPLHSRGPAYLSTSVLFGMHKTKQTAFTFILSDAAGLRPRAQVHLWWVAPTLPHVQLTMTAKNLFRRNFIFTDPFAVLKLVNADGTETTSREAMLAQRGKGEVVYRSEVYRNIHKATFLPFTFSLPPTFMDPEVCVSDNAKANYFSVFNVHAQLQLIQQQEELMRQGKGPKKESRPTLASFVGKAPCLKKGMSSGLYRPHSAPSKKQREESSTTIRPIVSSLFGQHILPTVYEEGPPPPHDAKAAASASYFDNHHEWPVVLMSDTIEVDLLDAEYEHQTMQCYPRTIGSFRFSFPELIRNSAKYNTNQLTLPVNQIHDQEGEEFDVPSEYSETVCKPPPKKQWRLGTALQEKGRNSRPQSARPSTATTRTRRPLSARPSSARSVKASQQVVTAQEDRDESHHGIETATSCHSGPNSPRMSSQFAHYNVHRSATYDDSGKSLQSKHYMVSKKDMRIFNHVAMDQANANATSIVSLNRGGAPSTLSKASEAVISDVVLGKRFAFQHFLSADWELSSYIVVDFTGGANKLHRTQVFVNSWNPFQGLIAAINKMLAPYTSRGGSDLYGAGEGSGHQFTVRPIYQYPDLFGVQADETSKIKRSRPDGTPPPAQSADSDSMPMSPPNRPTPQAFPTHRDWSGEHTLPHYEAHRSYSSRASSSSVPFFLTPVVRRMYMRCDAVQQVRTAGLSNGAAPTVPAALYHVVSIIIGSEEIADAEEVVELLSKAAHKPVLFFLLFVDTEAPAIFSGMPHVVTIDFFCADGFKQIHNSLSMLERAMCTISDSFLAFTRANGIHPGEIGAKAREAAAGEDAAPPPSTVDSDYESDRELAAMSERESPTRELSPTSNPVKLREDFDTAADRFNIAFGFPRRPGSARKPTRTGSQHEEHLRLQLNDVDIEAFDVENEKHYFAERDHIKFSKDGQQSLGVSDKQDETNQHLLRDASMTVVDLFMSEEELMKQAAETQRRNASAAAATQSSGFVNNLLVKKHLMSITAAQRAQQSVEARKDDSATAKKGTRAADEATPDDEATNLEHGSDDDDEVNLHLLSQERQQNKNIYQFEVQNAGSPGGMGGGSGGNSNDDQLVESAAPRSVTTMSKGGDRDLEEIQCPTGPVARAMKRLTTKGSNNLKQLSSKYDFVIPVPPKLSKKQQFATYGSSSRREWAARRLFGHIQHGSEVRQRVNAKTVPKRKEAIVVHEMSTDKQSKLKELLHSPKEITGGPKLDLALARRQHEELEQAARRRERQKQLDSVAGHERHEIMKRLQAKEAAAAGGGASGTHTPRRPQQSHTARRRTSGGSVASAASMASAARSVTTPKAPRGVKFTNDAADL